VNALTQEKDMQRGACCLSTLFWGGGGGGGVKEKKRFLYLATKKRADPITSRRERECGGEGGKERKNVFSSRTAATHPRKKKKKWEFDWARRPARGKEREKERGKNRHNNLLESRRTSGGTSGGFEVAWEEKKKKKKGSTLLLTTTDYLGGRGRKKPGSPTSMVSDGEPGKLSTTLSRHSKEKRALGCTSNSAGPQEKKKGKGGKGSSGLSFACRAKREVRRTRHAISRGLRGGKKERGGKAVRSPNRGPLGGGREKKKGGKGVSVGLTICRAAQTREKRERKGEFLTLVNSASNGRQKRGKVKVRRNHLSEPCLLRREG